jgi:hypothetical protein
MNKYYSYSSEVIFSQEISSTIMYVSKLFRSLIDVIKNFKNAVCSNVLSHIVLKKIVLSSGILL